MNTPRILLTGANGQLGTVLTQALAEKYGAENVFPTDIWEHHPHRDVSYAMLDVMDAAAMQHLLEKHQITQIYHLAAILSATGEKNPMKTWQVNMQGYLNVLEQSRIHRLDRIFFPSSIAVFGSATQKRQTPQSATLDPQTVYGISKVAGEHWGQYYFQKYGIDVRSLRYPGIISYQSKPGGGTTDYAVDIFYHALERGHYTCFLKSDTSLPMIYIDDAIQATLSLMAAPAKDIQVRQSYNLSGMSFTPAVLSEEIRRHLPQFSIQYEPDARQQIADSWPDSIDDRAAQTDWHWKPQYDLMQMTEQMIVRLREKLQVSTPNPSV